MAIRFRQKKAGGTLTRRATLALAVGAAAATQVAAREGEGKKMERVLGIGGFFFRAKDPKALAKWYDDNLGVTLVPDSYDGTPWRTEAGTTVFAPFPQESKAFGDPQQQWMINFRVRDLDAMAAQLRAKGVPVEVDPETYPNGRFGQLSDPEGNPIQLWQPGGVDRG